MGRDGAFMVLFCRAAGATKHSVQQAASLSGEAPSLVPCQDDGFTGFKSHEETVGEFA